MFFSILKIGKDDIGLVWSETQGLPRVEAVYLPGKEKMNIRILQDYPSVEKMPKKISGGIDQRIADLYEGKKQTFDPDVLNWSKLTPFCAAILQQTFQIPRGKVSTYANVAARAGHPRAVRAAGTALAKNPFPLVVPCHRVIRSDGHLGQFGGGADLKKRLLEKEGVVIDIHGRVSKNDIRL